MKSLGQKGFSVLHVLPMIAIVAVVAVIGVKVLDQSKAATALSCSVTASRLGSYVTMTMRVTNNTTTTLRYYADFKRNGATKVTVPATGSGSINAKTSVTVRASVPYAVGNYTGAVRDRGGVTTFCSGYYKF
jgi:hypothetical protein